MAQEKKLVLALAVAALTFGVTDQLTPTPKERPLANSDIVIVANEPAPTAAQTEESAKDSAKTGEEKGTHTGQDQVDAPEADSAKMSGAPSTGAPPAPEESGTSKE